ncbi:MAG TPA: CRISPR system precrRNA processing endoribonuclease RAMP protein Cas6, partial [Firmicutes bacterium]|nr:CRISPR system precrRNA processing endoribonuclease RAMP protein Cas6 [Bacillota bacterium]
MAGGLTANPSPVSRAGDSSRPQCGTADRSSLSTTSIAPAGREALSKGRGVAGSLLAVPAPVATHGMASTPTSGPAPGARDGDSRGARALVFDGRENKVYMQDAVVTWDDMLERAGRILACLRPAGGHGPEGGRPSAACGPAALSSSASSASCDAPGPSPCSVSLDSGSASISPHSAGRVGCVGSPLVPRVTVAFRTMTRLKFRGGLGDRPEFHILARSLLRRVSSLLYFHHGTRLDMDFRGFISQAEIVRLAALNTRWVDWERYSSRQDTRMKLGGLVGTATYEFHDASL